MELQDIAKEIVDMKKAIEQMQVYLIEDGLEVSDEVIAEVKEARESEDISSEDVFNEFCND